MPTVNGGFIRKWFHLLSEGGTHNGRSVQGLGMERAADLAHILMTWWLWAGADYPFAAQQSINAAIWEFGNCSQEHISTVQAMRAVGFNVTIPTCKTGQKPLSSNIANDILVYPNPSTGIFLIENPIPETNWDIKIYNVKGESLYSDMLLDNLQRIDLSGLSNGHYILTLTSNDKILTKKLSLIK